jgi:hypothetical protein
MNLKSLFVVSTTLILQISCSSKSNDANTNPVPKGDGSVSPENNSADGKASSSFRWLSDNKEVFIEPCKVGQVMVDAQCWDEVHFKPSGVNLTRNGTTFTFFENGAPPNDYLKAQYEYTGSIPVDESPRSPTDLPWKTFSSFGYDQIFKWVLTGLGKDYSIIPEESPAFDQLRWNVNYNFAPQDILFSNPERDNTLEHARVSKAEFLTVFSGYYPSDVKVLSQRSWRVNGTLEVCGKVLNLATVTQGEIEKTCGTGPLGSGAPFNLPIPNGRMSFGFSVWSSTPSDDAPGTVIYKLTFPDPAKATPPPAEPNPEIKSTEVEK